MPDIEIVRTSVTLEHLRALSESLFGDLVKAVVDIERGMMAIGGDLHADEEALLIGDGSAQVDLWGINLYPGEHPADDWIEFDSMINVRPGQRNRSRSVEDPEVRGRIAGVVLALVLP